MYCLACGIKLHGKPGKFCDDRCEGYGPQKNIVSFIERKKSPRKYSRYPRENNCQKCDVKYQQRSNSHKYCDDCRLKVRQETARNRSRKKNTSSGKPVQKHCIDCGDSYQGVHTGDFNHNGYCPSCAEKASQIPSVNYWSTPSTGENLGGVRW